MTTTTRGPQVNVDSIPQDLRDVPRWVAWRYEPRDGKPTKVPCSPLTGEPTDVTKPENHVPFDVAVEALPEFDGIGFALGDGYAGIDLDDCFAADGQPYNWARYILDDLAGTYAEVSPSGKGIKLFARGCKPEGRCRRDMPGGGIEMYGGGRFFTVTGNVLDGSPCELRDCTADLTELHATLFSAGDRPAAPPPSRPVEIADADLIAKAMAATNGAGFAALWGGDTSAHGGDDSRADLALCSHLAFWTGGDAARMDALFRQSGLLRPKWDDARGDSTYGAQTIAKAIAGATDFYRPLDRTSDAEPGPGASRDLVPEDVTVGDTVRPLAVEAEARVVEPSTWAIARKTVSQVRWQWRDWLPRGYPTVVGGETGQCKTWIALCLAGSVIRGNPWPDHSEGPTPGRVFWLEGEGRLRVNFERAEGMGIDLGGFLGMPDPFRACYLDDQDDFRNLEAMVRDTRPDLLVTDSWNRSYRGKEDRSEVRHTLDRVQHLVEEVDAGCLLLQHLRKPTELDQGNGSRVHRVRGSSALCDAALSVIGIEAVPGVSKQWVLSVWKGNLCERDPKPIGFTIRDGQVVFGEAPSVETRSESRLEEAREFLVAVLTSGPQRVETVKEEAKRLGIAEETLLRAKRLVADHRRTTEGATVWFWALKGYWEGTA